MASNRGKSLRARTFSLALALVFGSFLSASAAVPSEDPAQTGSEAAEPDNGERLTLRLAGQEFLSDAGRIWSSPFRLKDRHVGPLILFAATAGVLIATDEDTYRGLKTFADKNGWVGDVSSVVTTLGGAGAWAAAGLFYGAGVVMKDVRARETGYLAVSAILQSFLVSHTIKGFSGRQRPLAAEGEDRWSGPAGFFKRYASGNYGLYDSFPSGHAATAFSLATVVALQYHHRTWVGVLAYSLAAVASVSRVTEDRHWMSDVVVGAVLGHLVARVVVLNHWKRQRLVPVLGCSGRTVVFGFHYALDHVRR